MNILIEIDPQVIKGAIVSLSVSRQIPLIFSKSPGWCSGDIGNGGYSGCQIPR